jgi:hypothetical protein
VARGGEGGGGGRELREGPIYRGVRRWEGGGPSGGGRRAVRGAINGAPAACGHCGVACSKGAGAEGDVDHVGEEGGPGAVRHRGDGASGEGGAPAAGGAACRAATGARARVRGQGHA